MKTRFLIAALWLLTNVPALRAQTVSNQQKELADKFEIEYDYTHKLVLNSFFTLKLSDACWTRMLDDNASPSGVQKVNFSINQVMDYLKRQGLGDLQSLNSTNQTEALMNRPRLNRLVDAAKPNFAFTLDGTPYKACTDENWRLLLSYMTSVTEYIGFDMPIWKPRGGKADITLAVSPTAKKLTVGIDPEATKFTITAPVDEVDEWSVALKNGLRKGSR
jgi:hypothetical protein